MIVAKTAKNFSKINWCELLFENQDKNFTTKWIFFAFLSQSKVFLKLPGQLLTSRAYFREYNFKENVRIILFLFDRQKMPLFPTETPTFFENNFKRFRSIFRRENPS